MDRALAEGFHVTIAVRFQRGSSGSLVHRCRVIEAMSDENVAGGRCYRVEPALGVDSAYVWVGPPGGMMDAVLWGVIEDPT